MTLQQLKDLVAVVAHGGYRAASRVLGVSQAGLTKSLAKLEEEYGIEFLQRTAKGVVLTARGEEFMAHARAVLLEAERAEHWLQAIKTPADVQVKVGVSVEPSLRLVPAVLKDFRRTFPQAVIHLAQRSSSELLAAVRDGRLDLAVMRLPQLDETGDLCVQTLYTAAAALFVRRGHPLRNAKSIADLAASEWIVVGDPSRPGHQDESIQELFLQHLLGRPRFACVSDSLFGAISMLLESDCVARLPSSLLTHPLAANTLIEIPIREQADLIFQVGIVYKAGRRLNPAASQLASMLKSFSRMTQALQRSTAAQA
ncbi:LysR family transcriptional regulator [Variovorax gossypii]|uniref:LysR family transcriptional regulator n=1 Tax=Variovorax gossypii TaxID=1679495 RepID=A0A3S0GYZ1_9BURK|nr:MULTISPECIES: LysR substrate-binding domain-containing protein [Variovorax]MDR6522126.1 DNA-binding transcriptional LysR family regulator [Variovorax paradoxus]RTQ35574.1 LysR family transcriptional regulator [Variovorax gossypii]